MNPLKGISLKQQKYVETIDEVICENGRARAADLARRLNVSAASVSEAVGRLVGKQLAVRKSWHEIELTRGGEAVARELARRHRTLRRFMVKFLGMSEKKADENACRAEHCVSGEFLTRLISFADSLEGKAAPRVRRARRQRKAL